MLIGIIAVSILAAIAAVVAAYLWAERRSLRARCEQAEREAGEFEQTAIKQAQELAVAMTRLESLDAGMDDKFKALAADVLKQTTDQLNKQNKTIFESEQKQFEHLVKPIRELLDQSKQQIQNIEKERKQDQGGLRQMLTAMTTDQQQLRQETANLVKALRRPEVRGRWGELQLKRVAELAGMIQYCDFTEQAQLADGRRPDMVVHLPSDRDIVIDAKTPLDAYLSAMESETDADRDQYMNTHVTQIKNKVKELSGKSYQSQFGRTPDFVVLFIPGEPFLQSAVQREPELIENALQNKVVIATPSTLVALLKAVALGWQEQKIAESAQQIRDVGVEMHRRVITLMRHFANLGKAVDKTVEHYNKFVGSLESQVLPQGRRFEELGAASKNQLPSEGELPVIEKQIRELKSLTSE